MLYGMSRVVDMFVVLCAAENKAFVTSCSGHPFLQQFYNDVLVYRHLISKTLLLKHADLALLAYLWSLLSLIR